MRLEEERRRVEQEAARLEAERMEAIIAKEELARQAEDQIRSQEQLVSTRCKKHSNPSREKKSSCRAATSRTNTYWLFSLQFELVVFFVFWGVILGFGFPRTVRKSTESLFPLQIS